MGPPPALGMDKWLPLGLVRIPFHQHLGQGSTYKICLKTLLNIIRNSIEEVILENHLRSDSWILEA